MEMLSTIGGYRMTKAKNRNLATYVAVALLLILAFGFLTSWSFDYTRIQLPSGSTVNPGDQNQGTGDQANGDQAVTKPIKFVGIDELAGGALDGTTSALKVYDTDGQTLLETLSFSSGSCTSSQSYPSGKVLWCEYYYDTTIDAYKWWEVTVPFMSDADAQSLTTNSITLRTREAGAYTDSLISSTGLTITDGADLNTTGTANDTMTFTYTFYTTSDNTGYPSFHDPIYDVDVKPMIWATLTGTGYDQITLTGFDGSFERGSTTYYYKTLNDNDVSKYKVGNSYQYPGVGTVTFGFNAAGFSNSTTAYPTMQLYLKIYASAQYEQTMGDFGPYDFTGAEQTMLIMDI